MVKVGSIRIHSKFSGCHFVLEMKKKKTLMETPHAG